MECLQQSSTFFICPGIGRNTNIQPAQLVDFIVLNFRKDNLLIDTHGEISTPVKLLRTYAPKVPDSRDSNRYQTIQKFVHLVVTQGYFATDWPAFTNFETGN